LTPRNPRNPRLPLLSVQSVASLEIGNPTIPPGSNRARFDRMATGGTIDDPDTYAIIGAAMAVHNELGSGFLEVVYKAALAAELRQRSIAFDREVGFPLNYRGESLGLLYRADFICHQSVIVEVKAHHTLTPLDLAQALNYLRAAGLRRALLLNFGGTSLMHRRVVFGGEGEKRRTGGADDTVSSPGKPAAEITRKNG
jgi:GxxExxY protein